MQGRQPPAQRELCPPRERPIPVEEVERLESIDNGDGVSAAYVNADDIPEFSRPFPSPSKAGDQRAGGVEYHHFGGARVCNDDSAIGEESRTLHEVERNLAPIIHGA